MPAPEGVFCVSLSIEQVALDAPRAGPPGGALADMLSQEECLRYEQLPVHKRRVEWLAGRVAAKHALQRLQGAALLPRHAAVRSAASGRPAFDGAMLSISHSRRNAMAAAAHGPVGVDTETFDALRADSLSAVIRPWEVDGLRRGLGCDARVGQTLVWCLKEALFKAAGFDGFVPFAAALQVLGWQPELERPLWRWAPGLPCQAWPALGAWQARYGVTNDSAWVLVAAARAFSFSD